MLLKRGVKCLVCMIVQLVKCFSITMHLVLQETQGEYEVFGRSGDIEILHNLDVWVGPASHNLELAIF